jgi:hypothetical protein
MSYIGQSPGQGQAERFIFTATGGETSVTLDDAGRGIAYTVGQVDVYLNGVKLVNGTDFTATSGSSITGLSALVASDIVEIVALDAFSPADTVSASNGGTFYGTLDTQLVEPRTDDTYDLGTSSKRFQDAYLSGGIYLGGTGAANYLDDYEEGTCNITIQDSNGNSATMSLNVCSYTKVGNHVFLTGTLSWTSTSALASGSRIRFTGLPFTVVSSPTGGAYRAAANVGPGSSGAFTIPREEITAGVDANTTFVWGTYVTGNNLDGGLNKSHLGSSGIMYGFTVTYQTS